MTSGYPSQLHSQPRAGPRLFHVITHPRQEELDTLPVKRKEQDLFAVLVTHCQQTGLQLEFREGQYDTILSINYGVL